MLHALPSSAKPKRSSTRQKLQDVSSTSTTVSKRVPRTLDDAYLSTDGTASKTHLSPDNDSTLAKHSIPKPKPGVGKIADRVRSINDLQEASNATAPAYRSDDTAALRRKVSSATAGRAQPFVRRDASANQASTDTSHPPWHANQIHSPSPKRYQPELSRKMKDGASAATSREYADTQSDSKGPASLYTQRQSSGHFNPVPEPNQARDNVICPRHGRNLAPRRKVTTTTSDGMERSISGAYIPTGCKLRHQCEAVNPWVLFRRHLAKQEGTTVSPEICPDCIAEQDILARELAEPPRDNALHLERSSSSDRSAPNTLGPSSIVTEPGTPTHDFPENVLVGTFYDYQAVSIPGAAVSGMSGHSFDDIGTVVAADLGNMIDAIIIQHSGTLDKVITNIRDGIAGTDRMQHIARDIVHVAEAIESVPEKQLTKPATFVRTAGPRGKHSMILDVNPTLLRKRTRSIPLLLELIDAAAEDLGLNLPDESVSGAEHSSAEAQSPAHPVGTTLHLPGGMSPYILTPNPSAFPTPDISHAPQLGDPVLPTTSNATSPNHVRLPSEIFQSRDFKPTASPPTLPASAPTSTPHDPETAPPITQGLSRIPSLKRSFKSPLEATAAPRAYVSNPAVKKAPSMTMTRTASMKLAPYQNSSGARVRSSALVKPSEVLSKQKLQKTFEQEWLRDYSRASSRAERSGRRGRSESLGRGLGREGAAAAAAGVEGQTVRGGDDKVVVVVGDGALG